MKSRRRSEKAWFHDVGIGEVEYTRRNKFKMSTFQNISKALGHENVSTCFVLGGLIFHYSILKLI